MQTKTTTNARISQGYGRNARREAARATRPYPAARLMDPGLRVPGLRDPGPRVPGLMDPGPGAQGGLRDPGPGTQGGPGNPGGA